jgi:hypothetical protein
VRRAPFALFVFVVASAFAKSPAPEVIFISPCECEGFHGKNRWIVKTDFTPDVITVTGKAFYDIGHAPADHSNRRHTPKDYAVWEIHPVMKMEVVP